MAIAGAFPTVPADSVRVATEVYGLSLVLTVPFIVALVGVVTMRAQTAAVRALVLRASVVSAIAILVAHLVPLRWTAWIVPQGLALPLITLGRDQLSAATSPTLGITQGAAIVYLTVCAMLMLSVGAGQWAAWRLVRASRPATTRARHTLQRVGRATGITRHVRLLESSAIHAPATWGFVRPAIVLPTSARVWDDRQLHAALMHEMAHVAAADPLLGLLARLVRAIAWIHPLAWWLVRRYEQERELACDEAVIAAGVRRSDYAELLGTLLDARRPVAATAGLGGRGGMRARLDHLASTDWAPITMSRRTNALSLLLAAALSVPLGSARVVPTRDVLQSLMVDRRWESRAYAVARLAQRPDSVALARRAAQHDPSPEVRAIAQRALDVSAPPALLTR